MSNDPLINKTNPVIIYRLGSLGDTIVSLPCFHMIANTFSSRKRFVLTNFPTLKIAPPLEQVLMGSGLVDGVIEYPLGTRSFKEFLKLRREIKRMRSDTLIYLTEPRGRLSVFRDVIFFRLCGISKVIGAPFSADLYENRVDSARMTVEPECERLARAIISIGSINLQSRKAWDLILTANEIDQAVLALSPLLGKPFYVINMGGKDLSKDWGLDKWKTLVARFASKNPSIALVVVGSAEDSTRASELLSHWHFKSLNLCGLLDLRVCAGVLGKANFFLGHDSGPLHLAAAMGTTCIGLFGDHNLPNKWHPYGSDHIILHDMNGVKAITVNQVFDAIISVLNRHK